MVPEGKPLRCGYFEAGACRSCTLIETPYAEQLRAKERRCRELLAAVPDAGWLPAFSGGDRDFRNKAKLVVGGRAGDVALGILGPDGRGVDLRRCAIQEPAIRAAIPDLATFLNATGLPPYDVPARRGELKFVHVTAAPGGALMLRFVVRTEEGLGRIRARVARLRELVPRAAVISVNLLPEHKAVLEGEREEMLLGSSLTMGMGDVSLHLRPQSFFQTNTAVARELYAQAAAWAAECRPASLWDLYCGVGGFALRLAGALQGSGAGPVEVLGVELSAAAVRSARRSAEEAGIAATFEAGDATAFALDAAPEDLPELVVVNPPRRGIGPELAGWLEEAGGVRHVIYSSCNPESLARDLEAMPSLRLRQARVFDMFPHTGHLEVAVLLERDPSGASTRPGG
ncbi:methyltransferase domain-containing protein [Leucobacter sp. CSA1]|uniref:Methyltransferase domain-containing protein n=1 Tax=Leucobacter chromiisoli TaxID=2796471 RepID=A0A934Q6N7_9MICO|nr:methyltransferase domain-containing protein [Leucobacter chromiisoli]